MAKTKVIEKAISNQVLASMETLGELGMPVSMLANMWGVSLNYVKIQVKRYGIPYNIRSTDRAMFLPAGSAAQLQQYLMVPAKERLSETLPPSVCNPRSGRYKDYYRKGEVLSKLNISPEELDNLIINGKLTPMYMDNSNCKHTTRPRPESLRKRYAFAIKEVDEFERSRNTI